MRTIKNTLYNYEIAVFKGEPLSKAFKFSNKLGSELKFDPRDHETVDACVLRRPSLTSHIIWFKDKKPKAEQVAHEAFHSVFHIMNFLEAPLREENEEPWAYLLAWTIKEINRI